jgi:FAD/FMN-containing dehydrogenase
VSSTPIETEALVAAPPNGPGWSEALRRFADQVGPSGPVRVVGGRTHHAVGGIGDSLVREVRAPSGGIVHEPSELIVRSGAGTTVADLNSVLAAAGQQCALDPADPHRSTVGGVLCVGWSGLRRLRYGPVRDLLLEARYVTAEGLLSRAGAPVVKNVTGFDVCRLLVGSLGTLGLIGEVVLRCRPAPPMARWCSGTVDDPAALRRKLLQPSSVLWDGRTTWALLEGHRDDVLAEVDHLRKGLGFVETAGPPPLPTAGRWSVEPGALRHLRAPSDHALDAVRRAGPFVAEIGIGTVHASVAAPARPIDGLNARIRLAFDPNGRLNPGRSPW